MKNKRKNIYFIQRGVDGPIKIGETAGDPVRRLEKLQTASPETLYVIGCARGSEKDMHERFRAHHISGEWFAPHEDIINFARLNSKRPPLNDNNFEYEIFCRLPRDLNDDIERERQHMSNAAGAYVSKSAAIRALLANELLGSNPDIEFQ